MTEIQLLRRAVRIYPRTPYTSASAVRHARRQWIKSVTTLRNGRGWVMDGAVGWQMGGRDRMAA